MQWEHQKGEKPLRAPYQDRFAKAIWQVEQEGQSFGIVCDTRGVKAAPAFRQSHIFVS